MNDIKVTTNLSQITAASLLNAIYSARILNHFSDPRKSDDEISASVVREFYALDALLCKPVPSANSTEYNDSQSPPSRP